ncbi:MAG: TRAP transporter small permease [Deltaproteobacteria bacterium]|nr:TRAP transporter small permease [Deltaproteobacteria bacterium]
MNSYDRTKAWIQKVNWVIAIVGATLVALTMFVTTIDVVGRYFRVPFTGTMEISELTLAIMIFLGWAYTQAEKGHISIDIVFNTLPKPIRKILDVMNPLFGIGLLGLVVWQGFIYSMETRVSQIATDNLGIPVWPFRFMIVIGGITFCSQLVFDFLDACRALKER